MPLMPDIRCRCRPPRLLLDGELTSAEPKTLRYRLLHVASRLVHGGRRPRVWIERNRLSADELATVFARLRALPVLAG